MNWKFDFSPETSDILTVLVGRWSMDVVSSRREERRNEIRDSECAELGVLSLVSIQTSVPSRLGVFEFHLQNNRSSFYSLLLSTFGNTQQVF